jgi:glucose/arabinose dehydrogenase
MSRIPLVTAALLLLAGCYSSLPSDGGGQTDFTPPRTVEGADILLPAGYRIEAAATGLTFPTGVAFDAAGVPHVTESGYAYGEVFATPRLLRVEEGGRLSVLAEAPGQGPWNGVAFHDGSFFVAEGSQLAGGSILRIVPGRAPQPIIAGLPSFGDHHTNGPAVGLDGWIYFGQGTATNSGVVGPDSADFGWLGRFPSFHDTPCEDVRLAGRNFRSDNLLGPGEAVTGAYVPFGTATAPGQVVRGQVPCTGAVLRVRPTGGRPELVAWGLRNPFGLAFAPDGTLYLTDNAYDDRGSRPVWGAADHLWRIEPGRWYGWPDHDGAAAFDGERNRPPGGPAPEPVLAGRPGVPPDPVARLAVHSSSNGLDVARTPFGFAGEIFVAQLGDMAPGVGRVMAPAGFRVVRVDPATGIVEDFALNRAGKGPASRVGGGGLERPVALRFSPDGTALYVVDFGVMLTREEGQFPVPGTGVLWRITRGG